MNLENFSQSLHIPGSYFLIKKEFLLQKSSSIIEQSLKCQFLSDLKKIYFWNKNEKLDWILNEPIKYPKFETKFECKHTPNFCFCLSYCRGGAMQKKLGEPDHRTYFYETKYYKQKWRRFHFHSMGYFPKQIDTS